MIDIAEVTRQEVEYAPVPRVFTITAVTRTAFTRRNGLAQPVWVLSFRGGRTFPLWGVNLGIMRAFFGATTDAWMGETIEIYVDRDIWLNVVAPIADLRIRRPLR